MAWGRPGLPIDFQSSVRILLAVRLLRHLGNRLLSWASSSCSFTTVPSMNPETHPGHDPSLSPLISTLNQELKRAVCSQSSYVTNLPRIHLLPFGNDALTCHSPASPSTRKLHPVRRRDYPSFPPISPPTTIVSGKSCMPTLAQNLCPTR